jgi:hypothetical protein
MVLGTLRQQLLYPTWTEKAHHSPDNDAQNSGSSSYVAQNC